MRTADEIKADIESLTNKEDPQIQEALEKISKCIISKVGQEGTIASHERWLGLQFHGHLQAIGSLSNLDPIPVEATFQALHGNVSVAKIIELLGWEDHDAFKLVALDMLNHFISFVRPKTELTELTGEIQQFASDSAVPRFFH